MFRLLDELNRAVYGLSDIIVRASMALGDLVISKPDTRRDGKVTSPVPSGGKQGAFISLRIVKTRSKSTRDNMDGRTRLAALMTCIVAGAFWVRASDAQESVTKGKSITLNVATSPGGGYDYYARVLAKYLPKYLTGSPTIMVRNMPGAGGLVAANYLYNLAPKDGSEFCAFEAGTAFTPALTGAAVRFEPRKFGWLGSLDRLVPIVLARADRTLDSFLDLKSREMVVGGSGVGSSTSGYPYALNAIAGTKMKVVNGFPGSSEINLAIERGELDGLASWCWDCLKRDKSSWLQQKFVKILLQLSFEGDSELSGMGVPTLDEVGLTGDQKKLLTVVLAQARFGRPFAAPPGMPNEKLREMQAAFKKASDDPGLIEEIKRTKSEIRYDDAAVIEKLLDVTNALTPAELEKVKSAYSGGN